jgi:C4-dicarboxylate transporter DctM subunit
MEWVIPLFVTVGLLFIYFASGLPIALCLAVTGISALLLFGPGLQPDILGLISYNLLDSFVLTSIPMFLFSGEVLMRSGVSIPFYRGISLWLDRAPGGLLHANVLACGIFAAISGSSTATAATIGTVALPELERDKYDRTMVLGSLAAGGTLGILIPPSIPMIVYGSVTDLSIGRLFMAGVVPGIILLLSFMLYIVGRVAVQRHLAPVSKGGISWRMRMGALLEIAPMSSLAVIILGGIYGGVMTANEAAAIASFISMVLASVFGTFNWKVLKDSLQGAVRTTCMILFIMVGAQILQFGLVYTGISRGLVKWVLSLSVEPVVVFAGICVVYLVLGCLMDGISMMLLTLPVTVPAMTGLGYDPIWFGIILVVLIEIGLLTPPVGLNLFVMQGISGRPVSEIVRGSAPYLILMGALVALLTAFPNIVLFLPSRMLGP